MRFPDTLHGPETVVFRRVVYRLMGRRTYYLAQHADMADRKRAKGLHVAVWEAANGMEIPKGMICHHRDHNPLNNAPENLQVMSRSEHRRLHPPRDKAAHDRHLARVRPLTKTWHASEEGRIWHVQNGRRQWEGVTPHDVRCGWCGKIAQSRNFRTEVYCDSWCNFKVLREQGRYDRTVTCKRCQATFTAKPSSPGRYPTRCSQACGARSRPQAWVRPTCKVPAP